MSNGINALIARGGRQDPSVLQKYMGMRQMVGQEQRNQLAARQAELGMQATQQQMNIAERKQIAAEQEQQMKMAAAYMRNVKDEASYKQAATALKQEQGIESPPYDQRRVDMLQMAVYGEQEKFTEIFDDKGRPVAQRSSLTDELSPHPQAPTKEVSYTSSEWEGKPSTIDKINKERAKAKITYDTQIRLYDQLEDLIKDPAYTGGVTGKMLAGVNSIYAQYRSVTGQKPIFVNGRVDLNSVDPKSDLYKRLKKSGNIASEEQAIVIPLVMMQAKFMDPNAKITDTDYRNAEKAIGAGADKESRLDIIKRNRLEAYNQFNSAEKSYADRYANYKPMYLPEQKGETNLIPMLDNGQIDLKKATKAQKEEYAKQLTQDILGGPK